MDLLGPGAPPEEVFQALHWCMANDQLAALQQHLQAHCRDSNLATMTVDWADLLLQAADRGKTAALQKLLPYVSQRILCRDNPLNVKGKSILDKLLRKAVENAVPELCEDLLERGADANGHFNGKPLLHIAVCLGHLDTANVLLKGGANINCADQRGDGSIHSLLKSNHQNKVPALQWLISHGADIRQSSSAGRLPIHTAALTSADVIAVLLHEGLDVNSVDDVNGDTPLHLACGLCSEETIFKLIQYGANFNFENKQGHTPLTKLLKNSYNVHDFHSRTRCSLAKRLIQIGFRLSNSHGPHEHNTKHKRIGRDKIYDNYLWLMTSLKSVTSLQSISRCVVRENLCSGQDATKLVDKMEIPRSLKQYLMFRDSNSL